MTYSFRMIIFRTPISDSSHQYITDLGKAAGGKPNLEGLALSPINFVYKTMLIL